MLFRSNLKKKQEVIITGKVGSFKGKLQIVPEQGTDVQVVGQVPTVELGLQKVSALTKEQVGNAATVTGKVTKVIEMKKGGRIYKVDDGTGTIAVVVWPNVLKQVKVAPQEGQTLQALGALVLYKGKLEIVVKWPEDVVVK